MIKDYSPYCPECGTCGEEGCCSALNCKQSENGSYCEGYLHDLKFGYYMNRWVENNLIKELTDEQQTKYNEEWHRAFDKFYKI